MADNSGLPPIETNTPEPAPMVAVMPDPIGLDPAMGPSSKDMMIGGGSLLVLAIIFFFIRNAFVNYLVGSLKRSPNNAGLAAWGLFGGLLFGSAIGCIAIISKSFLTIFYIAPLAVLSLICFVLCLVVASKK
jgi:hypothetical protein